MHLPLIILDVPRRGFSREGQLLIVGSLFRKVFLTLGKCSVSLP